MKKTTKRKSSAMIPIMLGVIVILVAVVGIMIYSVSNQKTQKEPDIPQTQLSAVPATEVKENPSEEKSSEGKPTVSNQKPQVSAVSSVEKNSGYPDNYQIQFQQEWTLNKDFKGYLTLEGTALSTNVVQGTDNTFYRNHGFDGGTDSRIAFLDYRANIEAPSDQLLIYLPHANNHEKYGELVNFKSLEYYKEHPVINFNSLYRNSKYKVFAIALFPSGYEGIPFQTCMETNDKDQLVTLVQKAMDHSILEIPVDVRDTDELLTVMSEDLSLVDENGKYARIAVFARKIRDGESETVNTKKAVVKPNKYMPQSWYDQILRDQYVSAVNAQIREEAANWFSSYELSKIADVDLERMMNARKSEFKVYLSEQELLLSLEEKAHLYEKRRNEAENPVLTLDLQNAAARVGDEIVVNAARTPQDSAATFTWTSSDTSVVSVTGNGASAKLKALKKGNASVTVTSGKTTATCKVEVTGKTQFVLNPTSMTIFVDNSYNIKASTDIQQASSSDTGIAKVSINQNLATVYGVSPGRATITLTNKDGSYATCEVTVKKYELTFDKTTLSMKKGNRRNIYVATGAAMNWYVDNTNVVKMSIVENGKAVLVEAIGSGTATVTATARNGAQATCNITVDNTGVAFSTNHMDMYTGESREMQVTRGNVVKWEISDQSVADVCIYGNGTSIEVEALGYGTATIKAHGSDGSVATLTVNVSAPKESLTITPYSMALTQGDLRNITVTSGSASNWVSNDPSVAEVYVLGDGTMAQVEGRNPGTAIITVYDNYGGWVNCNVTVEAPAPKLVIGPGTVHMGIEDWEEVSVTSGKAVDWVSSDPNVVGIYTVGGDMSTIRIKGNGAGTAQVIAYAEDGSTAVCNVSVEAPVAAQQLVLSQTSMSIPVGKTGELSIVGGYFGEWISNDPTVAEVYPLANGRLAEVEGLSPGTATITAYWPDGSTASCTVTVEAPVATQQLILDKTAMTITVGELGKLSISGGYFGEWISSDPIVAEVYPLANGSMVEVEGLSPGTATITAYWPDGSTASCTVTVEAGYAAPAAAEDPLKLSEVNIVIAEGDWGEIYVTGGRCVDWNTSNQNIVRLYDVHDPTLIKIKGESAGTAEVIAYAPDGTTTFCTVTVTPYQAPEIESAPINPDDFAADVPADG